MHLVEIYLPKYDAAGSEFPHALYARTRHELLEHFGALTAHSLMPLSGLWTTPEDEILHDDVIVYEVIAERVERSWWSGYRKKLEERFPERALVVRSNEISLL